MWKSVKKFGGGIGVVDGACDILGDLRASFVGGLLRMNLERK